MNLDTYSHDDFTHIHCISYIHAQKIDKKDKTLGKCFLVTNINSFKGEA